MVFWDNNPKYPTHRVSDTEITSPRLSSPDCTGVLRWRPGWGVGGGGGVWGPWAGKLELVMGWAMELSVASTQLGTTLIKEKSEKRGQMQGRENKKRSDLR